MLFGLLTLLAEVKVFQESAFVSSTYNWAYTAAIALNPSVHFVWIDRLVKSILLGCSIELVN